MEAGIPVKYVTNINRVIGIGTTLHKFQEDQGKDIFLPRVSYHLPKIYVRLFSPQKFNQMNGGHYRLSGDYMYLYCKKNIIVITIWRKQANLSIVYNSFLYPLKRRRRLAHISGLQWPTPTFIHWTSLEIFRLQRI